MAVDHEREGAEVAAALVGFRTEPIAAVRARATVRILGMVETPETALIAPISGRQCVAFDVAVDRVLISRERSSSVFRLRDDRGDVAIVDPTHAQLRWPSNKVVKLDEADEIAILSGQLLVVVGAVVIELDRDDDSRIASYRGLAPTRVRIGGTPQYPLMISGDPDDIEASQAQLSRRW